MPPIDDSPGLPLPEPVTRARRPHPTGRYPWGAPVRSPVTPVAPAFRRPRTAFASVGAGERLSPEYRTATSMCLTRDGGDAHLDTGTVLLTGAGSSAAVRSDGAVHVTGPRAVVFAGPGVVVSVAGPMCREGGQALGRVADPLHPLVITVVCGLTQTMDYLDRMALPLEGHRAAVYAYDFRNAGLRADGTQATPRLWHHEVGHKELTPAARAVTNVERLFQRMKALESTPGWWDRMYPAWAGLWLASIEADHAALVAEIHECSALPPLPPLAVLDHHTVGLDHPTVGWNGWPVVPNATR